MKSLWMLIMFFGLLFNGIAQDMTGITGEGKTKDGKKVGKWVYTCDATGEEIGEERYDGDGMKHGYQTWKNCEGILLYEYNYDHGVKLGVQKEYFEISGKQLKREWSMVERSKKCSKQMNDDFTTDPEWYKEYYKNGRIKIELKGLPCEEKTVTKYRTSNGTEWIITYDDRGQWVSGPRIEEAIFNNQDIR